MSDRPNPLSNVAAKLGPAWGALAGVIVALVPLGIITQAQADSIGVLGDSVVSGASIVGPIVGGVLAAALAVGQAFTQARVSKDDVTPVADPRDNQGRALTPDAPATPAQGSSLAPGTYSGDDLQR